MSGTRLLVVAYGDAATAEQALADLLELTDERALTVEDAVVVTRKEDGGADVKEHEGRGLAAGEGVVGGGTIGLLVGLLVGGPIAGALIGAAGGAGASAFNRGIPDDELRRVAQLLEGHAAALIALVGKPDWARIRDRLAPYGGELIASEVAVDVAEGLAVVDP